MARKTFVLDTNVILHDHECIQSFEDNDIVLPITVLEELDQFKRGSDQINFNAREFIRVLDTLSGEKIVKTGTRINPKGGKIRIITEHLQEPEVTSMFTENRPDHRILSVAYYLSRKQRPANGQVILVSKDVNLRLKAKSLEIVAQDYFTDRIQDIDRLYTGKRSLSDFPGEMITHLYQEAGGIDPAELGLRDLQPHEYCILKNGSKSALGYHNPESGKLERIEKKAAYGILPRNAEQIFALHALTHPGIQLVTLMGKAGTGKTLLALAAALEVSRQFRQVYLARPIIPLSNRDLGFLPGDIESKLDPFMQPLFDNLAVIKNRFSENSGEFRRIHNMLEDKKLCITPLSYIRGRSLERIFFIVDEAQNLTPHEVKTIITRAGEGTKVVFTGDPYQIDTPYLDARSNGLTYLIHRMQGQKIYSHITLEKGERSMLAELASDLL
jgi:PhoH-like ATPase